MLSESSPPASRKFRKLLGAGLLLLAFALLFGILPMIVQARDRLDLQGGIAGAVVCAILTLTGLVLVFDQAASGSLRKLIYFVFGSASVFLGGSLVLFFAYSIFTGRPRSIGCKPGSPSGPDGWPSHS